MINETKITFQNEQFTQSSLEEKTLSELVSLYNVIASNLGKNGVIKFTDKETGRRRVWAILEEYEAWFTSEDEAEAEQEAEAEFDEDFKEPKETPVAKPKASRKKTSVGKFIKDKLVNTNETPAEIIDAVRVHFPDSKATTRDVAWYKTKLSGAEKETAKQPRG